MYIWKHVSCTQRTCPWITNTNVSSFYAIHLFKLVIVVCHASSTTTIRRYFSSGTEIITVLTTLVYKIFRLPLQNSGTTVCFWLHHRSLGRPTSLSPPLWHTPQFYSVWRRTMTRSLIPFSNEQLRLQALQRRSYIIVTHSIQSCTVLRNFIPVYNNVLFQYC